MLLTSMVESLLLERLRVSSADSGVQGDDAEALSSFSPDRVR